jgi:glycosyltransferase involved in cell wall biosynthesis/2-polyprenyl-3-methyl-5-hydroxy-6-metoxy-1,4-benzoquinol methylase/GT2 family glycosyltransferase
MPLRLIVAGVGEAETDLKRLAAGDPRIEFVGRIDDDRLFDLYANSLAIPFVPLREDYGYVTLEAFASGKAVVTGRDSGEPTRFVRHGENGLICDPNPDSLREALEWFSTHRDDTHRMGQKGAALLAEMSWPKVASRLVDAALGNEVAQATKPTQVTVLDMQPIDPPVGGGRLRLLGLYHNLGKDVDCQYIGTYDWPGERYRKHRLSAGLEEIDVPLSDEHHAAARALSVQAGGKTVIDLAFGKLGHLSKDYIEAARQSMRNADVVIFSHPWVFPLVAKDLAPHQVVIYDSHNVEGYLRAQLLDESNATEAELLRQVVDDEYRLGTRADLILACSHEDLTRFHRIYEFPSEKMRVVPNGVMAFTNPVPERNDKLIAKKELKLAMDGLVAIFIGSPYGPNVEAGQFIVNQLAGALPDVTFVIAGGIGSQLSSDKQNVIITGALDEKAKQLWLTAADIAVNPMFSGSGTNIKMFDFMAMSLPTITTAVGARGIEVGGRLAMLVAEPTVHAFVEAIHQLRNETQRVQIGREARLCVEEGYAWERISNLTGQMLVTRRRFVGQPRPFFSVVVPVYERHQQLDMLIDCLQKQIERDFEVVIVDQSVARWPGAEKDYGFPCNYFHSPVKGAVRARNTGALLAQGSVIAFTDDDCMPTKNWLLNARKYFQNENVVGVEGMIASDHLDDPAWRPVTNVNFSGIGFMTANLMVRSGAIQWLGGFDFQFDKPHFREDTDFGWRLQTLGQVPYANDVSVFHPAQSREIERESASERARFFQKDALLYKKHPARYRQLFFSERHFANTAGFQEHLLEGFRSVGVAVPDWIASSLNDTNHKDEKMNDFDLFQQLVSTAQCHPLFKTKIPAAVSQYLENARQTVTSIEGDIAGQYVEYFKSSKERYATYIAAIKGYLSENAHILDIGNAPGHVAMCLHELGYDITGINLNAEWRKTYCHERWLDIFSIQECDIEHNTLPFKDNQFDAILFTEVLEHIAVTDPCKILKEFHRVLKPGGLVIFSTPNVCNISNIYALLHGTNVFWSPNMFYGSLDRHNREYTPAEVIDCFQHAQFEIIEMWGINDYGNWRGGGNEFACEYISKFGDDGFLLRNTIIGIFRNVQSHLPNEMENVEKVLQGEAKRE